MKKISKEELKKILDDHKLWLESNEKEGTMANLNEANLSREDLSGANLSRADLSGADLSGAELNRTAFNDANLISADLSWASLCSTDFSFANLSGANLSEADLVDVVLSGTILSRADLSETYLNYAYFNNTFLNGTNLNNANFFETTFSNLDMSGVKNLDKCVFSGPCSIDFRTLEKSRNLPLSFTRGCGLPDRLIDYLPSLTGEAIEYYSCFISYSSKDQEFAERLYADLQNKGVRCWYAPEDLKTGDRIRRTIDEKIRFHDKLLLIFSENSVESDWVEKEVETAFEKERDNDDTILFPIRLDNEILNKKTGWPADIKRARHIGDFTNWKDHDSYTKSFDRLLRDLKGK